MIVAEFTIGIITLIVISISILLVLRKILSSPLLEIKLLLIAAFVMWFAVVLSTAKAYYSDSNIISNTAVQLTKLELALIGPFFITITLAFMLPNFRSTYYDIFQVSIIVAVNVATLFLFFFGVDLELTNTGKTRVIIPLYAGIAFIAATLIFLYYFITRLKEVQNIRSKQLNPIVSTKEMIVIGSIAVFSLMFLLFAFRFQDETELINLDLPSNTFFIPFSFVFILSSYFINKEQSYPFIIPVKLYGIILTEKETGLTILTKDYQEEIETIELLGNLFTALDLSLQETIQSTKTIEDIIFGDKVVHISTGEIISTIMIVSKNSLITKSLTKYLTREFEKKFGRTFINGGMIDPAKFDAFEIFFYQVRMYLPL